jgi:hypothetical protein
MEGFELKKIHHLKELIQIKRELQPEFAEYLEEEFVGLYQYLGHVDRVEDFLLLPHQAMIILEQQAELIQLMRNKWDLEFLDEVNLSKMTILRVGIRQFNDIQLYYLGQDVTENR